MESKTSLKCSHAIKRIALFSTHLKQGLIFQIKHDDDDIKLNLTSSSVNDGIIPTDLNSLPLPPKAKLEDGVLFPTFPQLMEASKKYGGLFSYDIIGGRRITFVSDPNLFEIIFAPHDMGMTPGIGDAIHVEMEKLAHAWFGIPRDIAKLTNVSLAAVRLALGPQKVTGIADQVGRGVKKLFDSLPNHGTSDLVQIAHGTFWPVNQAMFGECTINQENAKDAVTWFHQFDEYIPQVSGGMPATMFDEMQEAAAKIINMFEVSVEADNHLNAQTCPVLHDRLECVRDKFSKHELSQFMISIFWAPQANTLPITYWTLAKILENPQIQRKVEKEVRETSIFRNAPDPNGHFPAEDEDLPYTRACMKEALRMYISNLVHRKVARDFPLKVNGVWYRVPKNDMITSSSYLSHYDDIVFSDPFVFRPERWFEKQYKHVEFWPFAHGKWSCSGKFLALLEVPILVGLFFRDFDCKLIGKVPEPDWERVVASVRPQGWPYNTNCTVQFTRINNKFQLSQQTI